MKRRMNEDALLLADLTNFNFSLGARINTGHLSEHGALLAIADGMGGAAGGDVASKLAVMTLQDELAHGSDVKAMSLRLKEAVENTNRRVWEYAQQHPELRGMGTTLTATIISNGIAYIAQVGDSRAYLLRGKNITQITKDQSLVQQWLDAGMLDAEEAQIHPYRNILTQSLGVDPAIKVAGAEFPLCRNDYLLLCSDGLSNKISPQEMRQALWESNSISETCRKLIDEANRRGGEDNITVIVARFNGDALPAGDEEEPATEKAGRS
ncbi:MAG TPA: Stp1/IreP family PP2C-type Ser/Thr phosphatase, partial [Blastocatellia bacterium]|nr:Stp1/IreP family PP2C-type Ser/Thr phosphatase [Blastocatellia bacterium]